MTPHDPDIRRLQQIQARATANAARELAERRKREGFEGSPRQPTGLGDCLNELLQQQENRTDGMED